MKHISRYFSGLILAALFCSFQLALTSCSDSDNGGGGQPEITGVRVTDPALADSLFTKASAGSKIVIIGKNLSGIKQIFINGQNVPFNTTLNTDHSVIVNIPSELSGFKLTTFDKGTAENPYTDEIRVVTSHGEAIYAFKVTAPYPSITRTACLYPRRAGDVLSIYGKNLVDIENAYIMNVTKEDADLQGIKNVSGEKVNVEINTVVKDHHLNKSSTAYETDSELSMTIPSMPFDSGILVLECASGTIYTPFSLYLPAPTILQGFDALSSDMPSIGEVLTVRGTDFIQVEAVRYGDVTIPASDITVASSEDELSFVFNQKPSVGSDATLTVVTGGGEATVSFYDRTTILTTFDGDAADMGWGPNASFENAGNADGIYAHFNIPEEAGPQWWGTLVYYQKDWSGNSFAFSPNIPSSASASDVYLAFEVYDNESDFNNGTYWGYIRYVIEALGISEIVYDNFAWEDYNAGIGSFPDGPVLQDINGNAYKNKWYRAVVPLEKFGCYAGKTYADIVATGLNKFRIQSINQANVKGKIDIKIDNVRVIYLPKVE